MGCENHYFFKKINYANVNLFNNLTTHGHPYCKNFTNELLFYLYISNFLILTIISNQNKLVSKVMVWGMKRCEYWLSHLEFRPKIRKIKNKKS